jgi:MraZ protein
LQADKNLTNSLHISFTGEYSNTLDSKNRVNIPAKFRKALDPVNDRTFILTRGFDKCLLLYPLTEWQKVEDQLGRLSSIRGRDREFVRSITRHAVSVQYDGQGRIPIPEPLLEYSGISKQISVIGMLKKIELWDPEELAKKDAQQAGIEDPGFDDLANEINF